MKKISAFFVTIFTVAILYAAARPSLDGRAIVAQDGAMPKGLFARTVGYLPGDSVTVTNPLNGSIVDVLILGAIDPSEGVAILLSPEAAKSLGINDDSNVQVKITKRSGRLDETASGSAILASDSTLGSSESEVEGILAENTENVEIPIETPVETPNAEPVAENPVEVVAESETVASEIENVVSEEPVDVALENEAVAESEKVVVEEPVEVAEVIPENNENEAVTEEVFTEEIPQTEEVSAVTDVPEVVAVEEPFDPSTVEKVVFIDRPPEEKEEKDAVESEPITEETPVEVEDVAVVEENTEESLENAEENTTEEAFVANDDLKEEPEIAAEENVTEVAEAEPEAAEENVTEVAEVETEAEAEENTPEENAPNEEVVNEAVAEAEESEYSPIVLTPSEPNPPEASEVAVEKPIETAPVAEKTNDDWKKHIVPSLKNLQSGKYYIQIATLRDEKNIASTIEKYGKNYPIVLVPLASNSAYQVMIGALNVDEYGAVMERFKANGYKDLFLRRIR